MRVTPKHALLVVVLLAAFLLAVDTATAAEVGSQQIDCWPSSGGSFEVCG